MNASGLRFTLSVGSLPAETFVVSGFTLHEQYSALFTLELEVASARPSVEFRSILDNNATLIIWRETDVLRTVNGIVTSVEQGDTGLHQTRYRLSVRPALWRAGLRRNSRIFQQQSFLEILETLMSENDISDYAHGFRYTHAVREFCVQYNESDLDFLHRMAAEEGIYYFFEHENGKHTVVFADDNIIVNNGPTLPYYPNQQQTSFDELCITTFRRRESLRPSDVLLKDYTFKNPMWAAEYRDDARDLEHQSGHYLHYDYPGRYKAEPGEAFARWRIQALRNDAHQGEGASNCPALQPGVRFTLENHPQDNLNTRWQITQATHSGQQPQALETESGGQGTTVTSQFAFIPNNQTWRPLSLPKPRIDGAQIAIVTGPEGEEIFCDANGRVKVRFLWDRSGITDDSSSCWIRVSHPWAGPRWGMSAVPRIGHEVIVEFLNGDPDQPVIIGRTYHANHLPPGNLPGTKTQMSIRSKTHKGDGFNELRFEDEKGKEEVFIHAQKNMAVKVLNSKDERVNYNRSSSIGHDEELVVANDRKVTVEGNQDQKITGNNLLKTDGDQGIQVLGDLAQKVSGVFSVDSNGDLTLQSNSKLTLRVGGSFVVVHAGGVDIKAPSINLNSGGSPGDLLTPASPAVLKAAALAGSMFVAHCPLKDN
ncbi:type VI secretion system secreted protein VgrG [Serratia fonticola]|uniref:Type VI secretion system secreted protein VgrG n=1 Tax=Serratia fonticola TaxID=47917 RepID=A0A542BSY1_SERFO|nr:type VI secretion system tip protein VgrG [Serratia fonticola]TQI81696.1 type VI secretion system secreted protein VgrG [Serratia fonticola]TQI96280.1 type VI secretion system secreted protein VgrG [Serratia fonticola]TVZ70778.1 type VI secretion system secreted protein VgrG [Serratia fonticola]